MYVGLRASEVLHKKTCCIGPGLCSMLQANFRERMLPVVGGIGRSPTPIGLGHGASGRVPRGIIRKWARVLGWRP
jgi:hypothetical protein